MPEPAPAEVGTADPWGELLAERDLSFARAAIPAFSRWIETWFRPVVEGLDDLPAEPALFVGNHSGGVPPYESMVFVDAFIRRFGIDAPLYWLAHSLVMKTPGLGEFLLRCGALPASRETAEVVLDRGGSLMVYPGGEIDLHRPWRARNEIRFAGRKGFLRIAARTGRPIVPVVAAGGQSTYLPLTDGRRMARALGLDRLLRLKVLPVAVSFPWGLTSGLVPHLPLPAQIRIRVLPPIPVHERFGDDVDVAYDFVTGIMQRALTEIGVRRGLPGAR